MGLTCGGRVDIFVAEPEGADRAHTIAVMDAIAGDGAGGVATPLDGPQVGRVHVPCGLDIGSASAGEAAIALLPEIVAHSTLRSRRLASVEVHSCYRVIRSTVHEESASRPVGPSARRPASERGASGGAHGDGDCRCRRHWCPRPGP